MYFRDGNLLYGLDYLNGAYLRETAILSDSEATDTADSAPGFIIYHIYILVLPTKTVKGEF